MAEENDSFIEDDAIALEDSDNSLNLTRDSQRLFHLLWKSIIVQRTIVSKMKSVGCVVP